MSRGTLDRSVAAAHRRASVARYPIPTRRSKPQTTSTARALCRPTGVELFPVTNGTPGLPEQPWLEIRFVTEGVLDALEAVKVSGSFDVGPDVVTVRIHFEDGFFELPVILLL